MLNQMTLNRLHEMKLSAMAESTGPSRQARRKASSPLTNGLDCWWMRSGITATPTALPG